MKNQVKQLIKKKLWMEPNGETVYIPSMSKEKMDHCLNILENTEWAHVKEFKAIFSEEIRNKLKNN